jgi:preprotein translocase subunit Sec61beta
MTVNPRLVVSIGVVAVLLAAALVIWTPAWR